MNERCFALKLCGDCSALTVTRCPGRSRCSFYKPVWMQDRDQSRVNVRLGALPEEKQQAIADKYYNGYMPWRSEKE